MEQCILLESKEAVIYKETDSQQSLKTNPINATLKQEDKSSRIKPSLTVVKQESTNYEPNQQQMKEKFKLESIEEDVEEESQLQQQNISGLQFEIFKRAQINNTNLEPNQNNVNKSNVNHSESNESTTKQTNNNIKVNVNSFNNIETSQTFIASTAELINRRFNGTCVINKCEVKFSLDTMCDITTISEEVAKRTKAQIIKDEFYETMLADGKKVKVTKARVEFQIGNRTSVSEVMILPTLPVDCLIGQDIFYSHPELIDTYQIVKDTIEKLNRNTKNTRHKAHQPQSNVVLMVTAQTTIEDPVIEEIVARIDQTNVIKPGDLETIEKYLTSLAEKVSATELSELTPTDIITHKIELTNYTPIRQKCRPIPIAKKEIVEKKLTKMLLGGLIQPSNSPWRSPMHIVNKKDGDVRITIDFRPLNERTVKDALTVPYVKDLFQKLQDSKWFSKMDFASGYFQIKMDPESQKYTAFLCEFGLFEFNVMAMGLTNATATFTRFVQHIFADYLLHFVKAYIDDVMIHSRTLREHIQHVKLVIIRIGEYKLKIKIDKCEFVKLEISFLGHTITENKIKPMHDKIAKLHRFNTPQNIKQTRAFLGLAVYYKLFGKDFSRIAAPLYSLITTKKFNWTNECEVAFNTIRNLLTSESYLKLPSGKNPLILDTDACNEGIGAVLSESVDGKELPVGHYSKHLTKTEQNYSTTEREMMAITKSIVYFKYYLFGNEFLVRTDHMPLKFLFKAENLSPRLTRWTVELDQFQFRIEYRKGIKHGNADALSRLTNESDENNTNEENKTYFICMSHSTNTFTIIISEQIEEEDQMKDNDIKWIKELIIQNEHKPNDTVPDTESKVSLFKVFNKLVLRDNIVYYQHENEAGEIMYAYLVPTPFRNTIIEQLHKPPLSGHLGMHKTTSKIKERFFWPKLQLDVEKFIRECDSCQRIKSSIKQHASLKPIHTDRPLELVATDITGPLPKTKENNLYILVVIDHFTKFLKLFPIKDMLASTVATQILNYICNFGIMDRLLSDQGSNYESELIAELMDLLDIHKIRTTSFRPQTDGITERANQSIKNMIMNYVNKDQNNWDQYLDQLTFAYNTAKQMSTNFTPFELMFNRKPKIPIDIFYPAIKPDKSTGENTTIDFNFKLGSYAETTQKKLEEIYKQVKENNELQMTKAKIRYDRQSRACDFKINDLVVMLDSTRKKLEPRWNGPWVIKDKTNDLNYILSATHTKRKKETICHQNRLKRWHGNATTSAQFKTNKSKINLKRNLNEEETPTSHNTSKQTKKRNRKEKVKDPDYNPKTQKKTNKQIQPNKQNQQHKQTCNSNNTKTSSTMSES